jgi:hypothetical protein
MNTIDTGVLGRGAAGAERTVQGRKSLRDPDPQRKRRLAHRAGPGGSAADPSIGRGREDYWRRGAIGGEERLLENALSVKPELGPATLVQRSHKSDR